MFLNRNRVVFHELVHWIVLWLLAGIVISILQRPAMGSHSAKDGNWNASKAQQSRESFSKLPARWLHEVAITESTNVKLEDVLFLNAQHDYERAIKVWQQLDVASASATWKHVGAGVAHLRLQQLDEAANQLRRAIEAEPENAVAEYFLGRLCQARIRKVPFWHERDDGSPFRLARRRKGTVGLASEGARNRGIDRKGVILPQYKTIPLEKRAKQHFRRAIALADQCPLDRVIEIVVPRVRLASQGSNADPVTVLDLLISLDEDDYVDKAEFEVREQFVSQSGGFKAAPANRGG